MNPFLKRKGGKFYLKNTLLPFFPKHIQDYYEPFLGGGSVFLNLQTFGIRVKGTSYLNDTDSDVAAVWKAFYDPLIFKQLAALITNFALYSEDIFEYLCELTPNSTAEHAFKVLMLSMMSFQGNCKNYYVGIGDVGRKNAKIYEPIDYWQRYLTYLRQYHVKISNRHFKDILIPSMNRSSSFIFADPPYYDTTGYDEPFTETDHQDLYTFLSHFKGKFALTYNACDWVLKTYKRFTIIPIDARWCMNAKSEKNKRDGQQEVLIMNYAQPMLNKFLK